ncbi:MULTISPECIES: hypothetical protein [Salibacterium]|uniref:hypothetical protein n=1 Tax=Salibacterium TaxID=1884429 RepID=UPI001481B684|nr:MULTISPECIES: hypothetical protein [Salibacterium]
MKSKTYIMSLCMGLLIAGYGKETEKPREGIEYESFHKGTETVLVSAEESKQQQQ